jgi:hypothetical protein
VRRRELTSGNLACMFTLRLLEAGRRNDLVVELCWFAPGVQVLGIVSRLGDGNDATCYRTDIWYYFSRQRKVCTWNLVLGMVIHVTGSMSGISHGNARDVATWDAKGRRTTIQTWWGQCHYSFIIH